MSTSHETFIFICVDTIPPLFYASSAIWNWIGFCILNFIIDINMAADCYKRVIKLFWLYQPIINWKRILW